MPSSEFIYGVNPVIEILRSGRRRCHEVLISEGRKPATAERIAKLAKEKGVNLTRVKRGDIEQRVGTDRHQGVAARVAPYPYKSLEEVVATSLSESRKAFLVILDGITDPQNTGSIIRTAHLLGAHGAIMPRDNSCPITPAVVKASAGATEYLPIAQVTNVANTINYLKDKGIWVAAAEAAGEKSIYDEDFARYPFAIVLGAEGSGVRRLVREKCDLLLSLPMEGEIGSFNVSAAAAIIMGEMARQRRKKDSAKSIPKGV